jgi:NTE family protein
MRITDLLDPGFGRGGLLKGDKFSEFLEKKLKVNTFEELEIPLTICAADFWQRRQVVFDSGELMPALTASMALPGLISPVKINGRVLVDGAAVNPLPYDLLPGDCDFIIAIDVMGRRLGEDNELPSLSETIFNTYQIMQRAILEEKLKQRSPDLLLEVDLSGIRTLDFTRAKKIYEQAASAREKLDKACRRLLW